MTKNAWAVHQISNQDFCVFILRNSTQVLPRHPKVTAYRCFLPNLAGFTGFRRVGPKYQRPSKMPEATLSNPQKGIQPRCSGLRVQGTANSPLSTTQNHGRPV